MARTREFVEQEVVERAMRVFWEKGYEATSLNDLLEAMDLSKSSFYETFKSKQGLLLQALRLYLTSGMAGLAAPLAHPQAGRLEIEEMFRRIVDHALSPDGQKGCLLVNSTAEVAPHDATVLSSVRMGRQMLEDALCRAVGHGQQAGTIATQEKPRSLARYLGNALWGINVLAKARPDRKTLDDIARVTLKALD